jgi:hypothetical protein
MFLSPQTPAKTDLPTIIVKSFKTATVHSILLFMDLLCQLFFEIFWGFPCPRRWQKWQSQNNCGAHSLMPVKTCNNIAETTQKTGANTFSKNTICKIGCNLNNISQIILEFIE